MRSTLNTSVANPSPSLAASAAAKPNESTLCATSTTSGTARLDQRAHGRLEGVGVELGGVDLHGHDLVDSRHAQGADEALR